MDEHDPESRQIEAAIAQIQLLFKSADVCPQVRHEVDRQCCQGGDGRTNRCKPQELWRNFHRPSSQPYLLPA